MSICVNRVLTVVEGHGLSNALQGRYGKDLDCRRVNTMPRGIFEPRVIQIIV
jgi:hypothetical protein